MGCIPPKSETQAKLRDRWPDGRPNMSPEMKWLEWSRRLQALAQNGLTYCKDPYDEQRYNELRSIAAEMMAFRERRSGGPLDPRVDFATQRLEVDWLGQERFGAALQRLALGLRIAVGGDHDDGDLGPQRLGLGQKLQTGHSRHVDV